MFNYKFSLIVEKGTFSGGSLPNVFFRTSALSHRGLFQSQPIIPTHLKKKTSSLAGGRSNSGFFLKSRVDIFLRLLIPGGTFYILKKKLNTFFFFFFNSCYLAKGVPRYIRASSVLQHYFH